ncbi:uncharacterized protein N7459_002396 [Penicillium hispanicum]|uniref:uncharacterized protein n=1 Tax=Penicillium hispanicum TaxID=1080232 RepID=UPI0025412596|nr:uncharacterized protein N7459_002396 [Penicillium hispanicum]KAJ5592027.1 hypothetical protein N7459_002396 [Penicillium hispanicum]
MEDPSLYAVRRPRPYATPAWEWEPRVHALHAQAVPDLAVFINHNSEAALLEPQVTRTMPTISLILGQSGWPRTMQNGR